MAISPTSYQAPSLHFNGEKEQDNTTHQSAIRPQKLEDILFRELGNSSAQLRIMLVLTGTKEGFFISEKWMCERTGLVHSSYSRALKTLVDRGWVSHVAYSTITVNFDKIYEDGKKNEK